MPGLLLPGLPPMAETSSRPPPPGVPEPTTWLCWAPPSPGLGSGGGGNRPAPFSKRAAPSSAALWRGFPFGFAASDAPELPHRVEQYAAEQADRYGAEMTLIDWEAAGLLEVRQQ
jgi:hypothetical protein